MSYTTALGVTPNERPVTLAEFHNSHGWSPSIWRRLVESLYGYDGYLFAEGSPWLDRLWREVEQLPEWQQAPLVLTFDTGVIPRAALAWAADMLDEFDRRLPAPADHVNHVPAMAELLRSEPGDAPLFGVWGTSVTENPFDPWNAWADEPGNGIPLYGGMYVLERHRGLLPPSDAGGES